MNKKVLKFLSGTALLGLAALDTAQAQATGGILTVTNGLLPQMTGVADLLSALAYLSGIGFGIKAALKLKEYNDAKGQMPISAPITMAIVAGLLISLPSLLNISSEAIFGTGNKKTGLTSGGSIRQL